MDIDLQVSMKCLRIEPTIYWFSDEVSRYLNYAEQYQTNEKGRKIFQDLLTLQWFTKIPNPNYAIH